MEVVVGTRVIRVVDVDDVVDDVVVDVVRGTVVCGAVSSVVVVVSRFRAVVVVRGPSVLTGTRTAGTSSVGGGGWGRTQR